PCQKSLITPVALKTLNKTTMRAIINAITKYFMTSDTDASPDILTVEFYAALQAGFLHITHKVRR
ncbi:hypothetical protein MAX20_23290, partial [Escherichia coli]